MSDGGEFVAPHPWGYSLTIRSMLAFAHTTPRLISGEGVRKRASRETVREVSLRVVKGALIAQERLEDGPAAFGAALMVHDGEAQRLARARRHRNAILERAEDAAADELRLLRRDVAERLRRLLFGQGGAAHRLEQHLLAQRELDRHRRPRTAPPSFAPRFEIAGTDEPAVVPGADFVLGFAIEALPDQHRPRKERDVHLLGAGVVQRNVDDERNRAIESAAARNVEGLRHVNAVLERELGDLRVGQKRDIALDLMREKRTIGRDDRRCDAFRR